MIVLANLNVLVNEHRYCVGNFYLWQLTFTDVLINQFPLIERYR